VAASLRLLICENPAKQCGEQQLATHNRSRTFFLSAPSSLLPIRTPPRFVHAAQPLSLARTTFSPPTHHRPPASLYLASQILYQSISRSSSRKSCSQVPCSKARLYHDPRRRLHHAIRSQNHHCRVSGPSRSSQLKPRKTRAHHSLTSSLLHHTTAPNTTTPTCLGITTSYASASCPRRRRRRILSF
jgi:hypothetical protein